MDQSKESFRLKYINCAKLIVFCFFTVGISYSHGALGFSDKKNNDRYHEHNNHQNKRSHHKEKSERKNSKMGHHTEFKRGHSDKFQKPIELNLGAKFRRTRKAHHEHKENYFDKKNYHPISDEVWKNRDRGHLLKLISEPKLINMVGERFTFTPSFVFGRKELSPNSDVKITILKGPDGLTVDSNNQMTFTPLTVGQFEIVFTATMGKAVKEFTINFEVYDKDPIISRERISTNGGSFILKFKGTSYDNARITIPKGAFAQSTEIITSLIHGSRPDPLYEAVVPTKDPLLSFDPPLPSGSKIELAKSALNLIPRGFTPKDFVMSAWTSQTNHLSSPSILDHIILMATMELGYQYSLIINNAIEYYGPAYTKYQILDHGDYRLMYLLAKKKILGTTQMEIVDPLITSRIFSTIDLSLAKTIELGCGDIPRYKLINDPPIIVYGTTFANSIAKTKAGLTYSNIIYLQNSSSANSFTFEEVIAHEFFHQTQYYLTPKPYPKNEDLFRLTWWIESTAQDFMNTLFPTKNYITKLNPEGWDEKVINYGIGDTYDIPDIEINYDLITWISYLKLHTGNPNFVCDQYKAYGDEIAKGRIYDGLDLVGTKTLGEKYLEFADAYSVTHNELNITDISQINPVIDDKMLNYPSPAWEIENGWKVTNLKGALSYKLNLKIPQCEQKKLVIDDVNPNDSQWLAVVRNSGPNVVPPTDCSVNKSCYISDLSKPDDLPILKGGDSYTITLANAKFPKNAVATEVQPPMNLHISLKDAPNDTTGNCAPATSNSTPNTHTHTHTCTS